MVRVRYRAKETMNIVRIMASRGASWFSDFSINNNVGSSAKQALSTALLRRVYTLRFGITLVK